MWLLFGALQVNCGIIAKESSSDNEDELISDATYISQATVLAPNQNYHLGTQQNNQQQQNNQNIYQNSAVQSIQNSVAALPSSFHQSSLNQQQQQQQQQHQLPVVQQEYSTNTFSSQHIQQNQVPQYSANPATNFSINRQQTSYLIPHQTQGSFQNIPANYQQNNYNNQAAVASNSQNAYENRQVQSNDRQNFQSDGDSGRVNPISSLDFIDTNSKSPKKVPLVLITIQKNKNNDKTKSKKQNSKEDYGSQIATSNIPISSNVASSSVNGFPNAHVQDNRGIQNVQLSSGNVQQQHHSTAQTPLSADQIFKNIVSQGNFIPVPQYRYPILAGKKQESSEWKPVEKSGIRVIDVTNINNGFQQTSANQQSSNAANHVRQDNYNTQNPNAAQTAQQNSEVRNNYNLNQQQYQQIPSNTNVNSPQNNGGQGNSDNINYQLTSAYVQQANFKGNTGSNFGSISNKPLTGSNYALNNIQGSVDGRLQQQEQLKTQHPQNQAVNINEQFSIQGLNNNYGSINQNLQQPNSHQSIATKSTSSGGTVGKQNNVIQSTNNRQENAYYNQGVAQEVQNNFARSYSPSLQQNNQNTYNTQSSNSEVRNNPIQYSRNVQNNVQQNTFQTSLEDVRSNAVNGQSGNRNNEPQKYFANSFNALPQNNARTAFPTQNIISSQATDLKNRGVSQSENYRANQQNSNDNKITSHQQSINNFSGAQRNTFSSNSFSNQQQNPTQNNFAQSDVKTSSQTNQNQGYNQNISPESGNIVHSSNQENRNNLFQNNVNSNRQSNTSPNNYQIHSVPFQGQVNQEQLNSNRNPSYFQQSVLPSNYASSQNQGGARSFQGNSGGISQTNYQINQQRDLDVRNRGFEQSPASGANFNSNNNNYQNTNYGSSESQASVIGTKPDEVKNNQQYNSAPSYNQLNENKHQVNFDDNSQGSQIYSNSQEDSKVDATNKDNTEANQDSAPEALLLVLVSAKKSAIEDYNDDEKDDINEGYESSTDEIMELLSEESNRKLIMESINEAAANAEFDDDVENEEALERSNDDER